MYRRFRYIMMCMYDLNDPTGPAVVHLVLPSYMKRYHISKYTTILCMQNVMHHEHFSFPVDLIPALIPLNVVLPHAFNIFLIHLYKYNSTTIYILNSEYLDCTCNQKFTIYILSYIPNMFIRFINSNVHEKKME